MKVLVTGVKGQLGHDVVNELEKRGHTAVGVDIEEMDITDFASVEKTLTAVSPEAVIHCAAWTAVDAAEDAENQEKVHLVNAVGTENIAKMCKHLDIACMYISTDYVFNGQGTDSWKPDCKDYAPLNVYGQSKLDGELAVSGLLSKYFIVRIAWVFGLNGNNFIKTMLKVGANHDKLTVVNDQIGSPTYSFDLAKFLIELMKSEKYGFYHATNFGDYISWYDFACEIFRQRKYTTKVIPVSTFEYGLSKANRPFNSRLEKSKIEKNGFTPLPDWKDALKRYLIELDNNA